MNDGGARIAVRLDIVAASEPLEGIVTVGDGPARDFHSWLELIAALEAATSGADG